MDFKDKVVLVTGASSGIGAAAAAAFAARGAAVALVGRSAVRLAQAAERCQRHGHRTLTITADFTKDEEVVRAVQTTVDTLGKLDVLVNGVGAGAVSRFADADSLRVYRDMMASNLTSAVVCSHAALPHLVATRGNIVNISSVCATNVVPITSWAYCVAKAGLDHFTRCAAAELGPSGVRVNSVNPGPVRTNFFAYKSGGGGEDLFEALCTMSPLGRVCEPDEVADLALFVAGERARGVTGAAFVVDNGFKLAK